MGLEAVVQLAERRVEQVAMSADMPFDTALSCLAIASVREVVLGPPAERSAGISFCAPRSPTKLPTSPTRRRLACPATLTQVVGQRGEGGIDGVVNEDKLVWT